MAGKKAEKLGPGVSVSSANRLWALFSPRGRLSFRDDGRPHIYATREEALQVERNMIAAHHVVRLDDITGTVYR